MKKSLHSNNARSQTATSLVELVATIFLFVPVVLLAINLCCMCLGGFINEEASREAARAAGGQASAQAGSEAAMAALATYNLTGSMFSSPSLASYIYHTMPNTSAQLDPSTPPPPFTVADLQAADVADGQDPNSPNFKPPYTRVYTGLVATTPAPVIFAGSQLASQVTLTNMSAFPIIAAPDPNPDDTADSTPALPADKPPAGQNANFQAPQDVTNPANGTQTMF